MAHWTIRFFIEKGRLWLRFLKMKWRHGIRDARAITKLLVKYGIAKGNILELGCGNGRISSNLARAGYVVTGIDISDRCLIEARERARKRKIGNVHYICSDIRAIDTRGRKRFDAVISIWTSIGFYNKATDEKIFKKVAQRLRKKGIFMILQTMSREFMLCHFCPSAHEEVGNLFVLHEHDFDKFRSIVKNKWIFYEKSGRDLNYIDEVDFQLRVYSMPELIEMAERAGLEFVEAFDSLRTLAPARHDSHINIVFRKK